MTLVTVLLVAVAVEVLAWLGLTVAGGRLMTYGQAHDMRLAARLAGGDEGQDFRPLENVPDYLARSVIHPYLGYVLDRDFHHQWRVETCGPDSVEHGFNLYHDGLFHERSDAELVVAVTGGSMAFNLLERSGEKLEQALRNQAPSRVERVVLFNLALPGYKQPQQLMVLNYYLVLGARFDMVINIDGFNEIALPPSENINKGVFPFFPRGWFFRTRDLDPNTRARMGELTYLKRRRARLATTFAAHPLCDSMAITAVWALLDTRLELSAAKVQNELLAAEEGADAGYLVTGPRTEYANDQEMYSDLIAVWFRGSLLAHRLAAANGIAYHHFLQPNQYLPDAKPMDDDERRHAVRPAHRYGRHVPVAYPLLIDGGICLRSEGVRFHDLTAIFTDVEESVYRDDCCHLNPFGHELLAAAIADGAFNGPAG